MTTTRGDDTVHEDALRVTVTPASADLGVPRSIVIDSATPGSLVSVTATTQRGSTVWRAQATFLADDAGHVDLATDAPVSGDYRTADAMGLFWSQQREGAVGSPEPADVRVPIETVLVASTEPGTGLLDTGAKVAGRATATAIVVQRVLAEGVTRTEVRERGLVGTLFRPVGIGPFPTVVVLNGSGGGIPETRAALYAARGVQALALGYFRADGLSDFISRTPLEYFERALDYVADVLDPAGGAPVVSGQSRGGELTLLLGAMFPERIAGLAAIVPSAFVCGAQGAADPSDGWDGPAWTWRGVPLEHLWNTNREVSWQPWNGASPPTRHSDVYVDGLRDTGLAREARIAVERFRGPVACVSGLDDRAWPSSLASRIVMSTLSRHGHSAERLLLDYEDAGHSIGIPHLPSTDISRRHPVSGVPFSGGGTPRANAAASADAFEQLCAFFHRAAAADENP